MEHIISVILIIRCTWNDIDGNVVDMEPKLCCGVYATDNEFDLVPGTIGCDYVRKNLAYVDGSALHLPQLEKV